MAAAEADTRLRFRAQELRQFTAAVLEHFGMPAEDATLGAAVLIDADLQGIESHGIAHLPWHMGYVPGFKGGFVNPHPKVEVLRETASSAAWDGDRGFGPLVASRAMEACIEKAEQSGIGMVTVRNGRHFGAAGYYAHMAAKRDLIGMAMCNFWPLGAAAGGVERVFGTNPLAMSAPVQDDHAFLLDMATTAVAGGKLEIAERQGKRISLGWAIDASGADTDDPSILQQGGALLPLGSRLELGSYKGYGLGLMVDIFCGMLSGVGSGLFMERESWGMGQWFAAWRIDLFRAPAEFKAEMKAMVDHVRATKPATGVAAVLIPGDVEAARRSEREASGIPLEAETIKQLTELAEEVGGAVPRPLI